LAPLATELQPLVEHYARIHNICAVSFATVKAGKIESSGVASGCESTPLPTEGAVFQAASLSKPVFAYAVLQLVQQGRLNLDTPLLEYLPQGYEHVQNLFAVEEPPITDRVIAPELRKVTARMVLTHTSGLPNWSDGPLTFDFSPGSSWQYSGEGFLLLQHAVEAITAEELDEFMRRQVFEPLGMASSAFRWKQSFANKVVPGFSSDGHPRHFDFRIPIAPASLYTTANDYAKFIATLVSDTNAVQATISEGVSVRPSFGLDWGLGWGIERGDHGLFIWQWGNNPGYRAFAMASPSTGEAFVVFTNSESGLVLAEPIVNAVIPGTHNAFKFYMLREGAAYFVCKSFDWCM
jgi:CubicO group peptidase (beta-lactamase class C family)